MAKKYKFELNHAGVGQLLNSSEMQAILDGHAGRVLSSAGAGYGVRIVSSAGRKKRGTRLKAIIRAETSAAKRDVYENNTLLKALGGG